MDSTAIATIDLNALSHNLAYIRQKMPKQKILAMIKSNAYGHGLTSVAKAFHTADALGVATIDEAVRLRKDGVTHNIIVMRGFITQPEITVFLNDPHFIACVHHVDQVNLLKNYSGPASKKLRIWLKVDTGMHRLGVTENDFQSVLSQLQALEIVEKPFVICSHLAEADNLDPTFTQKQITLFEKITKDIAYEKSLLNSAGIIAHQYAAYDWIRPGLMLYGVSPFQTETKYNAIFNELIPAMTLESKLIAIKSINVGEKIGYSCAFTATNPMKIGIVGMGYGDSYPRHAKNGTPVLIRGQRCPIVGRVSMDMITVDVSHVKSVAVNDAVTLWGRDLLVSEIAQHVGTVPHELLCHLTGRVQLTQKPHHTSNKLF